MLLVLLIYQQAPSPYGEMDSKTSVDSPTLVTELSREQPEIKASTNLYTTEFLAEVEEVGKKKSKKKSISTAYLRDDNALLLLKFVAVQRAVNHIIQGNIPLYKIFHSWKIPLL